LEESFKDPKKILPKPIIELKKLVEFGYGVSAHLWSALAIAGYWACGRQ
jgi:hypothetical protein